MSEKQKYLHHCDRCGELFKSARYAPEDIRCTKCGEHPVHSKFASLSEMPALNINALDTNRGIPGKDEADIFSMNKKKQRNNWIIICCMWLAGLGMIAIMTNKVNNQAKQAAQNDIELNEADRAYASRKEDALQKCATAFKLFATDNVIQSKSSHILNGSDLVLDINRYYGSNLMKNDLAASRIIGFDLIETGKQPKFVIIYRYRPQKDQTAEAYNFEVIFWQVGEDWFIDWPHFVRLGDMNWYRFTENKKINSPKRFKLYAREPITESLGITKYKEYKFSEAYNNSNLPSQLEKLVLVENQTSIKTRLTSAFRDLEEKKRNEYSSIIGTFDQAGKIRVDVTLDFEKIEGETVMVLKEIHDFDWQTPPTKKD